MVGAETTETAGAATLGAGGTLLGCGIGVFSGRVVTDVMGLTGVTLGGGAIAALTSVIFGRFGIGNESDKETSMICFVSIFISGGGVRIWVRRTNANEPMNVWNRRESTKDLCAKVISVSIL